MNIVTLLIQLIAGLSPEVRTEMTKKLDAMEAKTKQTKLPFDDIGVAILRGILGL